jgi:hypothetical protein
MELANFDLLGDENSTWGSVFISSDCILEDYLRLLNHVRRVHPGIWAYDRINDVLHSPATLVEEIQKLTAAAPTSPEASLAAYRGSDVRMMERILQAIPPW